MPPHISVHPYTLSHTFSPLICTVLFDICDKEEEEEESEESEEKNESDLEGMAPAPKRCKLVREKALKVSLQSGLYLTFRGSEGPSCDMDPGDSSANTASWAFQA